MAALDVDTFADTQLPELELDARLSQERLGKALTSMSPMMRAVVLLRLRYEHSYQMRCWPRRRPGAGCGDPATTRARPCEYFVPPLAVFREGFRPDNYGARLANTTRRSAHSCC